MKRLLLSMLLVGSMLQMTTHASTAYNIAKGLEPVESTQSIEPLKDFKGDFRILGSKIYTDDEQSKF